MRTLHTQRRTDVFFCNYLSPLKLAFLSHTRRSSLKIAFLSRTRRSSLKLSFLFYPSHTTVSQNVLFFHTSVWTRRSTVILDHERNHDRRVAGTGQATQSLPRTAGSLLELWVAGDVVDARRLHPGVQPTARSAPGDAELSVRALIQDW